MNFDRVADVFVRDDVQDRSECFLNNLICLNGHANNGWFHKIALPFDLLATADKRSAFADSLLNCTNHLFDRLGSDQWSHQCCAIEWIAD